ncbi:hypothetical protein TCDM_01599 [Trypanosoma cruzi Dm28c]|uniref:Uncharacterized protein n=1 Tax=Trypanosoma cruzi Dm28c TaxID=1416333 RepID=V5BTU6_TRYCR|nr:hypothetical protein TCDM_01599 [Trypanosoma cruzi Dm28c]
MQNQVLILHFTHTCIYNFFSLPSSFFFFLCLLLVHIPVCVCLSPNLHPPTPFSFFLAASPSVFGLYFTFPVLLSYFCLFQEDIDCCSSCASFCHCCHILMAVEELPLTQCCLLLLLLITCRVG